MTPITTKTPTPTLAERLAAERARLERLEALELLVPKLGPLLEDLASADAELARADSAVARATERRAAARAAQRGLRLTIRETVAIAAVSPAMASSALGIPVALCTPPSTTDSEPEQADPAVLANGEFDPDYAPVPERPSEPMS